MALPDVTFLLNGGDAASFDHMIFLNMTDNGPDAPQQMQFSNDGVDYSPCELFAVTKSWDLRLYGGGTTRGIRCVFARFINGDGEVIENDCINIVLFDPSIRFDSPPLQRDGELLVDIPYIGIEYLSGGTSVSLLTYEYDVTGMFAGSERQMSVKEVDPAHTGVTGLLFSPTGQNHNLVWDLLEDLPEDAYSNVTRIRLVANYGNHKSEIFITDQFIVDTRPQPAEDSLGPIIKPGDDVNIECLIIDPVTGQPMNADAPPTVLTITDPDGTDVLGGSQAMSVVSTGYYRYVHTVSATPVFGQYIATIEVVVNGETSTKYFYYVVGNDFVSITPVEGCCVVTGKLIDGDCSPLVGANVFYYPQDMSNPEYFNSTSINTQPVEVKTDGNGFFQIPLVINSEGVFTIFQTNYRRRIKVPDEVTANYLDLGLILPTPPRDIFGNTNP